jgi:hypothetical protein
MSTYSIAIIEDLLINYIFSTFFNLSMAFMDKNTFLRNPKQNNREMWIGPECASTAINIWRKKNTMSWKTEFAI